MQAGNGAETDMGYIYLRYGPPNTIVKRHNETDYYPYEIWHYHRAGPFTNKRFLFFSPHMVAECFTLLHSDMLGEVSNNDWLQILRSRENPLRVTSSQLNRLNPRRDTFRVKNRRTFSSIPDDHFNLTQGSGRHIELERTTPPRNVPTVCRRTLREHAEVVVVDNGSTDDSTTWLKEHHPSVRVVELDENKGFAGGYNDGLERVTADVFVS